MGVEIQFRIREEAYKRFGRRQDERGGPKALGDRLALALTDFLDEIEATKRYQRHAPTDLGNPLRRAKLRVDDTLRARLEAAKERHGASKEELVRHAIGRVVDWY